MRIVKNGRIVFEAKDCYIDAALDWEKLDLQQFTVKEFIHYSLTGDAAVPSYSTLAETLHECGLDNISDERDLIVCTENCNFYLIPGKSVESDDDVAFAIIQEILHEYDKDYLLVKDDDTEFEYAMDYVETIYNSQDSLFEMLEKISQKTDIVRLCEDEHGNTLVYIDEKLSYEINPWH